LAPSFGILSRDGSDKGEKINFALRQIEIQRKELDQLRLRVRQRRATIFNSTVQAIKQDDEMRVQVLSQEHHELQKVEKVVSTAELSLLHISVRLETMRDIGDVTSVVSNSFKAVKRVGKSVLQAVPRLEARANEMNDAFSNILAELGSLSPDVSVTLADTPEDIFAKAQQLIEERTSEFAELSSERGSTEDVTDSAFEKAKRIALLAAGDSEKEDSQVDGFGPVLLSEPNFLSTDAESAVRNYVRERGIAKIDVLDCSAQLNLPVDLVEQAYIKLLSERQLQVRTQRNSKGSQ
jgi:division protein CdvB (Snf7/Vps24/ESCRT-III family)